jgi:hypothetical protein
VCFVHFDFEMFFAPQRRALFRNLNFQKWSEHWVYCTFWLLNVLHATTACTFSTSQLPKWSDVGVFCAWKCTSRVQLLICHLTRWLRTAALASLLFDHPELQIIRKTQCIATFLPFRAPASSTYTILLAFTSVHIVESLTSRLPSNKNTNNK